MDLYVAKVTKAAKQWYQAQPAFNRQVMSSLQVSDTILRQISKLENAGCWACGAPDSRMQVFMLGANLPLAWP